MASERRGSSSKCGWWIWGEVHNGLLFVSRDSRDSQRLFSGGSVGGAGTKDPIRNLEAIFQETVGSMELMKYRNKLRRKVKYTEPDVVILQDIKDVVLFTCNVKVLSTEFIKYFHTRAVDRFLRSMIIYFQYYFQVWNKMQIKRIEAKRKLRQPIVTVLENVVRDDLADLRSMVARDYSFLLTGSDDSKKFHHMNNKNNVSLSDKDRKIFEIFIAMVRRVVWIALNRKYMSLIEKELDRLLRTISFSLVEHFPVKTTTFDTLPEEERILVGKNFQQERRLLQRSPAIQELILDHHDFRMLAIGVTDLGNSDPRQEYLQIAYTAPEELLEQLEVGVGILGVPRRYLDPLLKLKELSTTKKRDSFMKPIPEFVIPPKIPYSEEISELPNKRPCPYVETEMSQANRSKQCKMWTKYLDRGGMISNLEIVSISPSYLTLRTSITFQSKSPSSTNQ